MSAPRVSVVVPLYKEFRWLGEALASLRADGLEDFEALLVDDGSPVDPRPFLTGALSDPRFRLIRAPHGGIAAARNAGAREARAEWLAFLDQDDVTLPGRFARQLAAARGAALVYSDYERVDESGRVLDRYESFAVSSAGEFIRRSLGDRAPAAMGTALLSRAAFESAGGFDPAVPGFDETELFLRLAASGGRLAYVPGVAHRWREHAGNTMKSAEFEAARLAFLERVRRLAERNADARAALPAFEARSWYALGLGRAERGDWKGAREWLWKAWRREPARLSALYLLGKSFAR